MSLLKSHNWIIFSILLLSGCMAHPSDSEMQKFMEAEKLKQQKLDQMKNDQAEKIEVALQKNKIVESNLSVGTPEYVAYQYSMNLLSNEYQNALKFMDEDIKTNYRNKVIDFLERSIKYKYYEPVYDIFGKNVDVDQIRKTPIDKLLSRFIELSVRRNFKSAKVELAFVNNESNGNDKQYHLIGREVVPVLNRLNNIEIKITLNQINDQWKVKDDTWLIKHINKEIKSITQCQSRSFRIGNYTEKVSLLNHKVCQYRAQLQKNSQSEIENVLPEMSGVLIRKTYEEISRDEILNNQNCMDFINGEGISLTTDIVSTATCDALNIKNE